MYPVDAGMWTVKISSVHKILLTTGRNADAGLTFLRHSGIYMIFQYFIARITTSAAVYGRTGCTTFHNLQFGRALVSLSPPTTTAFLNTGMSDCPASTQSGTGMNKNSDAGTSLVQE
jgi:hypothetical protein